MRKTVFSFITMSLMVVLLLLFQNCAETTVEFKGFASPENVVCDPFDDPDQINEQQGILGHLYYLTDDMPRVQSVGELIKEGHSLDNVNLFLSELNVSTRPFDRGFVTNAGTILTNENNEPLYEYFALDLNGRIQLSEGKAPGQYQMMILADDGAVLYMDKGHGMEVVVDNDGDHPTKMVCATNPVEFDGQSSIPYNLKYYQGPLTHIALVVMWRPWPENEKDVNDPLCGKSGFDLFFDSTQTPPRAKQTYKDLLSRNWSVVRAENYLMPSDEVENPCNTPAISNIR